VKLEILPVGVNGAFTVDGFHSSFLIRWENSSLLFDCGFRTPAGLSKLDIRAENIEAVYLSHLHLDHSGGLAELGFKRMLGKFAPLKIYGEESVISKLWPYQLEVAMSDEGRFKLEDFFELIPVTSPFDLSGLSLQTIKVQHIGEMPCFGLVLGEKVYFSADSVFDPALIENLESKYQLKAIFHDCSFNSAASPVHATLDELRQLPNDLQSKILLTHYEDEVPSECDLGEMNLAKAGQSIRLE